MPTETASAKLEAPAGEREAEEHITMEMLHALSDDHSHTQRGLAARLNIALGLTNAYLKRCSRKGLVKIRKIPPNRYAYYLTPKGFAEKSRLTANYLTRSFNFYRHARNECDQLIEQAADHGLGRIALAGAGELAEVAMLCALQFDVEIVGVAAPKSRANRFRHVPLAQDLASLQPFDAVLLTDLNEPQKTYEALLADHGDKTTLLLPPLLKIQTAPGNGEE